MHDFFESNLIIIMMIYVILFFLLGFSIKLKLNKKSELQMAKSLWLLAGYGFSHGMNEFIDIIILVKQADIPLIINFMLQTMALGLKALSFMFIYWLGISLVTASFSKYGFLKTLGSVFTVSWLVLAMSVLVFRSNIGYLAVEDNLARYMFALPGFFLAGIGLLLQIKEVEQFKIHSLVKNLKGLAFTFFCNVFFIGMITDQEALWPSTVLNRQSFMEFTGIPVIFFRSLTLACITYFVIRIVDVFEVEREYRLEEALRQQVLMDERERIARELHDGIIQSIYGVGLKLEQALNLADRRLDDAKGQLISAKDDLNHTILDIRDYIQELQPADYSCTSLLEGISQLVRDFRNSVVMQVKLAIHGKQTGELNIIQVNNVLQIIRELLTNCAKHSRATTICISVKFKSEAIQIRVSDNGVGFDPSSLRLEQCGGEKQGLKNVYYRVGMLQGTVVYNTVPGQGTHFEITLPYRKLNYVGGVFINDPEYFEVQAELS